MWIMSDPIGLGIHEGVFYAYDHIIVDTGPTAHPHCSIEKLLAAMNAGRYIRRE